MLEKGDLVRAAQLLNSGSRVAMLSGPGALGAASEVTEVADLLGAGVAKALLGRLFCLTISLGDRSDWAARHAAELAALCRSATRY